MDFVRCNLNAGLPGAYVDNSRGVCLTPRQRFINRLADEYPSQSEAPGSIQYQFSEWLRDDHSPLHEDDDHQELWEKFCDEMVKP